MTEVSCWLGPGRVCWAVAGRELSAMATAIIITDAEKLGEMTPVGMHEQWWLS